MPKGVKTPLTEEQKAANKAKREAEKASNFIRLADARVKKALDAMAGLRGLANRNTYTYNMLQVAAIFKALEGELNTLQGLFAPGAKSEEAKGFSLVAAVAELAPETEDKPEGEEKSE